MSESTSGPSETEGHLVGEHAEASRDTPLEEQLNSTDKRTPSPKADLDSQEPERIKLSARDILDALAEKRIDINDIQFSHAGLQDSGGKGDVILATLVITVRGQRELRNVAVKKLRLSTDEEDEKFLRAFVNELRVLDGLSHLNIVKIIGFVEDIKDGVAWMVFPWEANGNVRQFLRSEKWEIPERVSLIKDVASGLEYLHTRQPPICHGDLKSLNVLVNSSFRAVITDFGSARIMRNMRRNRENNDSNDGVKLVEPPTDSNASPEINLVASDNQLTLTGPSWSFRWAAPEILNGEEPGLASDIWALG
ncbi:hypothetical protein M407DRAFT_21867 [Tulasnella calospora MUT 4182]|uniref:Protein kinase domain-containing protein n=1 Tax=Tulasnella calospora MUT 4182 TaxID=1051891 RepID=A0A0C3QMC2_9AGAM|nr:hypothetical protein M407DRAFT_21867 [Tulasnella calospora MUT 4182]